ncbi:hypothetical protein GCM10011391_11690 [Pullulanibacillus camelliae]|uniref:ATPase AAA-type core domain-containing protein n=1 Tax=Pullulanibacillus camelliae TaxID=1707096 RepID=A0A8J2VPW8_9BACL|nr:hypothetical protein GCM10011391_11690 [Pullulanibacillus camelliae]
MRQLAFLSKMHELVQQHSQFIIAAHSPIIMAYPQATVFEFTEDGIKETTLEETQHYRTMKLFFEDKERFIHHLFTED